jgi:hypothetical protein
VEDVLNERLSLMTTTDDDFYRRLNDVPNPNWDTVKTALLSLKDNPYEQISLHSGSEDAWLVTSYKEQYGFYVMGVGLDELDYSVLYEPDKTDEIIALRDGQDGYVGQPRFVCVEENVMLQALEVFYRTGQRDQSLSWWLEYELEEQYDIAPIDPDDCED